MKIILWVLLLLSVYPAISQGPKTKNVFIITTDGFRWQEIFNGADSTLINDPIYVSDTSLIKQLYWDDSPLERRKKLMPFFWNVIVRQGQLYGNRSFNNKVNVKNLYKISYPGYNELLTGYADPLPMLNTPTFNRNKTILEYFNDKKEYNGKVVAFSSWYIFPYVFNTKRNDFIINSGYQLMPEIDSDSAEKISEVQNSLDHKPKTRFDLLTFLTAKEYIQTHYPRIVYLSFGETDEFAHQKKYDMYLQQANNVDKMIAELWYFLQTDPFYKNNTTLIITTDHGRGSNPSKRNGHNTFVKGSGEIWLALLGKSIEPLGEMKDKQVMYQNQLASTIASLMDNSFVPSNKMGKAFELPGSKLATSNEKNQALATIRK